MFLRVILGCAVAGVAIAGCTVDVGPDVQPPAGCNAPTAFFVSDVWPKYFAAYGCGKSDCHDASTGHGFFRLQSVDGVTAPMPTDPLSAWPQPWQANLRAVQQNVSCSDPLNSLLLTVPSGRAEPHEGGLTVTDTAGADALFNQWLK